MHGSSFNLKKNGETRNKKQKYYCKECRRQFITDYSYQGCRPFIRSLIVLKTWHSFVVRDISQVLSTSTNTVLKVIRQAAKNFLGRRPPIRVKTVELDEL